MFETLLVVRRRLTNFDRVQLAIPAGTATPHLRGIPDNTDGAFHHIGGDEHGHVRLKSGVRFSQPNAAFASGNGGVDVEDDVAIAVLVV
jgi:hypothetical protein